MKSGLKAAGSELVFGIYDGFSGLVVQPYTGARDGGAIGFCKGVGMGLTGFVLKDLAAIIGPFGYTFKGVHKEILKPRQPTHFIRKARIIQGKRALQALSDEQRKIDEEAVDHGWNVVRQIWKVMDDIGKEGVTGRLQAMKERKTWRTNGAFDNVEMAERALEAKRRGESLDGVFLKRKTEIEKSRLPKRDVANDLGDQKTEYGGLAVDRGAEVRGRRMRAGTLQRGVTA